MLKRTLRNHKVENIGTFGVQLTEGSVILGLVYAKGFLWINTLENTDEKADQYVHMVRVAITGETMLNTYRNYLGSAVCERGTVYSLFEV